MHRVVAPSPRRTAPALLLVATAALAHAQSRVVAWGELVVDSGFNADTFVDVDAGATHTYGLRADGTVAAWGSNDRNQCLVPPLPPGRRYVEVRAGGTVFGPSGYGIARRDDGSAVGWALLPGGVATELPLPTGVTCVDVAASSGFWSGGQRGFALLSDGTVMEYGTLGTPLVSALPAPPPGLTYVAVAAGSDHGLALRSDGVAVGWGSDFYGQASPPAPPPGRVFVELDAGEGHSLGRLDDGTLLGWGDDTYGQASAPALPAGVTYTQVEASGDVTLALRSDGGLEVFGSLSFANPVEDAPPLPPGTTWVELGLGLQHAVGLRSDGVHVTWGNDADGCLNVAAPAPGERYTAIAAGRDFGHALTSDGAALGFGGWPIPALPPGVTFVALDSGWSHTLGLRSDGEITPWGSGNWGQNDVPPLPAGTTYVDVSAGGYHSLALRSDGVLVGFGRDNYGQASPPAPAPGTAWVELGTADDHSYARQSDGTLVGFGYQSYIQTPAPPAGRAYVDVEGGGGHTLARLDDGSAVSWGQNFKGQGDVPALPPGTSWVRLTGQKNHGLGLDSSGALHAWGADDVPSLRARPELAPGERVVAIDSGFDFNLALVEPGPPCGSVARFCLASPSSAGAGGAVLELSGCPAVSADDLVASASGLPPGSRAFLRYAPLQAHAPFGAGLGCLAGPITAVPVALTGSAAGSVQLALDLDAAPFDGPNGGAGPLQAGTTWNFQLVYRDEGGPTPTFNTSDALHVVLAP